MKTEIRTLPPTELRVVADDSGKKMIRGYAAVYNKESEVLWYFREVIKPGAFRNALAKSDVRALFNHDSNLPLGRYIAGRSNNTLRLQEDATGLYYEIDPPDTSVGRDLMVSIDRGDITGSSFAFRVLTDNWRTVNGEQLREIEEFDEIFDVSPVTYPAYPDSSVGLRSAVTIDSIVRRQTEKLYGNLEDLGLLSAEHREKPYEAPHAKRLDQLIRESQNRRIL